MKILTVKALPIELYKILKIENWVMSGGEAKVVISEGMVEVNGEAEYRKRRKIIEGDVVEFNQLSVKIEVAKS